MDPSRRDFFVSYTSADENWAEWISHVLEEAGYTVVVQIWDFRPGSNFVIEMQKALQYSDRLIAVLSPDYLVAGFPQPEWAAVFASDPEGARKRLVPVMVRECEPEGLLSQVVQIRIQNLDPDAATMKLLDGLKAGRAKPTDPPAFPGGVAPSTADGGAERSTMRLRWRRLTSSPTVAWRSSLDDRLPNQSGSEAVELHLVPVGDEARLQVRELSDLSAVLPGYGRQRGVFSAAEALDVQSNGTRAAVTSAERGVVAGLAVTRSGQRSAWSALPRDMLGAVLDESHLADQLAKMLDALIDLPVPAPELIVPAAGVEPARMVSVGKVIELPRTSAQVGLGMPEHLRPEAEDALVFASLRRHAKDIGVEMAARLVAEHKIASRRG